LYEKFYYHISILTLIIVNLSTYANDITDTKNPKYLEIAEVKRVVDGDTIHLYTGGEIIKTRLYGIDCMETAPIHRAYHQAYDRKTTVEDIINQGNLATKIFKKIIKENNNTVYFKAMGIDRYGRLLAIIYDKNYVNINNKLKENNYCEPYVFINK